MRYSVAQVLFDADMSGRLCGRSIIPIALLHTLTIVADTIDDWFIALREAGVQWVSLDEAMSDTFYAELGGKADETTTAVTYFRKAAAAINFEYPEIVPSHQDLMQRVKALGKAAHKDGHIEMMKTAFAW